MAQKQRVKIASRHLMYRMDKGLSDAQDAIGRIGPEDPVAQQIATDAFFQIEAIRRKILKATM